MQTEADARFHAPFYKTFTSGKHGVDVTNALSVSMAAWKYQTRGC
jgi:hypothetical protein